MIFYHLIVLLGKIENFGRVLGWNYTNAGYTNSFVKFTVSGWGLGPFGCGVPVALVPGQVAKPAKLVSTKAVRICVRFGCFGNRWCW